MMFLDCPAHLDQDGAVLCGLPAEVRCRFTMHSTDGPVESAMISCPAGHYFCGAVEDLAGPGKDERDPHTTAATSPRARHRAEDGRGGRADTHGFAVRYSPAGPEPGLSRPSSAPAYYQGRPAHLWIAVMRPRRGHTRSDHAMQVVAG